MILPAVVLFFCGAVALLYLYLRARPDRRSLWRSTIRIGLVVGIARAALASLGWYTVEHTGGPLQVPAYALTMFALPEAALLPRRRVTVAPPEFYVFLSLLLIAGTLAAASIVALAVRRR